MTLPLPTPLAALLLASQVLLAQSNGKPQQAANPVTMVSRAEVLMRKGDKEDAALMLWQALDLLRGKELGPIEGATQLSALFLLKENDKLEAERRAAFTSVAQIQAALAKSYRIKKWYDTAQERLDVAAQFDRDVIAKEQTVLASKRPKTAKAKPSPSAKKSADTVSSHLRESGAKFHHGPWSETEDGLRIKTPVGYGEHCEWICNARHEENEIVIEIKPDELKQSWNAAIGVGLNILPDTSHYSGYRCHIQYFANTNSIGLYVWRIIGMKSTKLVDKQVKYQAPINGYHRFAVRVKEGKLELQANGEPTVTAAVAGTIRGRIGVLHGVTNTDSCGLNFRNLVIGPLPEDAPSDEELREQTMAKKQHAITASVEEAKALLAAKQPEQGAHKLRDALEQLQDIPEGILRTNLAKSIQTMLGQADRLTKKRGQAAQKCAAAFADLADKYAADGRARMARVLALQAMRFDPQGVQKRLAAIDKMIEDWNVAQLTIRAAELAAPSDDGALLREWFVGGRLLNSNAKPWVVSGPSARLENASNGSSMLMPKKGTLASGTASVYVRLPIKGCQAGICFDTAGPHDFSVAMLIRNPKEMVVNVSRWAGGKWIYLSTKKVPIDAWRLEAWHQLMLEVAPTGIKVKALGVEIKLDRKRLGDANDRIGLYAANVTNSEATLEIRAFQAKPK